MRRRKEEGRKRKRVCVRVCVCVGVHGLLSFLFSFFSSSHAPAFSPSESSFEGPASSPSPARAGNSICRGRCDLRRGEGAGESRASVSVDRDDARPVVADEEDRVTLRLVWQLGAAAGEDNDERFNAITATRGSSARAGIVVKAGEKETHSRFECSDEKISVRSVSDQICFFIFHFSVSHSLLPRPASPCVARAREGGAHAERERERGRESFSRGPAEPRKENGRDVGGGRREEARGDLW